MVDLDVYITKILADEYKDNFDERRDYYGQALSHIGSDCIMYFVNDIEMDIFIKISLYKNGRVSVSTTYDYCDIIETQFVENHEANIKYFLELNNEFIDLSNKINKLSDGLDKPALRKYKIERTLE